MSNSFIYIIILSSTYVIIGFYVLIRIAKMGNKGPKNKDDINKIRYL